MFLANEQIISWLALFVVAAAISNNVPTLADSASGDDNACAGIATAYARWIANQGEYLQARKKSTQV